MSKPRAKKRVEITRHMVRELQTYALNEQDREYIYWCQQVLDASERGIKVSSLVFEKTDAW